MWSKRIVLGIAAAAVTAGVLATLALGQEAPQERPRPGREAGARGRFDRAQMRQRMLDRFRQRLGATEEEWKVLAPRIEKVTSLSQELGGGGVGRMFGRRRAPRGAEGAERELSPVEKAAQDLNTVLEDENATAEQISQKLTALRAAREKIKQDLAKAQKELKTLLTQRQEAQLVLMGVLD